MYQTFVFFDYFVRFFLKWSIVSGGQFLVSFIKLHFQGAMDRRMWRKGLK